MFAHMLVGQPSLGFPKLVFIRSIHCCILYSGWLCFSDIFCVNTLVAFINIRFREAMSPQLLLSQLRRRTAFWIAGHCTHAGHKHTRVSCCWQRLVGVTGRWLTPAAGKASDMPAPVGSLPVGIMVSLSWLGPRS